MRLGAHTRRMCTRVAERTAWTALVATSEFAAMLCSVSSERPSVAETLTRVRACELRRGCTRCADAPAAGAQKAKSLSIQYY